MRLFPTLAAALLTTAMIAACDRGTAPASDQPKSDQAIVQPGDMPADIPSASTTSETNAALNSTAPTSPAANATAPAVSQAQANQAAAAPVEKKALTRSSRISSHRHHKLGRSLAKNHHKHKHGRQAVHARVQSRALSRAHSRISANTEHVAILDTPLSDAQNDREDFKRQMQWRVANIADGVSRYHNQASITDSLSRFSQKVEDVKIADALARRQLRNIDTVSNDRWPSFKSNFQSQISQLERDYQGIKQASR